MTASKPRRAWARAEAGVQVVIMFAIGLAAGAASFTHVHDLAAAHRQGGWLAWADAVVLELMSVAAGLEIRRRRRHGVGLRMPATVLACAVTLSLSAQVVQAEHSIIGITAAAVPAVGFLTMVKIALGTLGHQPDQPPQPPSAADDPPPTKTPAADTNPAPGGGDRTLPDPPWSRTTPGDAVTGTLPRGDSALPEPSATTAPASDSTNPTSVAVTGNTLSGNSPVPAAAGDPRPSRNRTGTADRLKTLLPPARQVAADLAAGGETVSRDRLVEMLRERGYTLSNAQAGRLLAHLDTAPTSTAEAAPVAT